MKKLDDALQYYIEYESHNRLNNISIPEGAKGSSAKLLDDPERLRKHIKQRKRDAIGKIFDYEFKKLERGKITEFLDKVFNFESDDVSELKNSFEESLKTLEANTIKQTEDRISRAIKLLTDDCITILAPIYGLGSNNMHLIGYRCYLEDNLLRVGEFKVNRDVLEKLMLIEVGFGLDEVLGGPKGALEYFASLHDLEFNSYQEAHEALNNNIVSKFDSISKKLTSEYKDFVLITIDGLNDTYYPPFKDDMQLIRLRDDRADSGLLRRYLLHNEDSRTVDELTHRTHFGSYTDKFSVNEKQWKVICGSHQADMLAVSGPPGTGKTTLLKELIADISVKKTKRLITHWDDEWTKWKYRDKGLYCSPFKGKNNESIIVTSTNNDAVNNIGLDVSKDIEEIREKLGLKLRVDFSSKLGNSENKKEFFNRNLSELKKQLSDEEGDVDLSEEIDEFKNLSNQIEELNKCLDGYMVQYKVMKDLELLHFEGDKLSIPNINNHANSIETEIKDIQLNIQIKKQTLMLTLKEKNLIFDDKTKIKNSIELLKDNIALNILETENIITKRSTFLNRKIILLFEKFGKKVINKIYGNLDMQEVDLKNLNIEHSNALEDLKLKNNIYTQCELKEESIEFEIESHNNKVNDLGIIIEKTIEFFKIFDAASLLIGEEALCMKEKLEYNLFNVHQIVTIRYRLFELSLIINEGYILKHKKAINNNIDYIMSSNGKILGAFYRSDYKYDISTEKVIRQVWEAFCLCFPVITTTLHSYSKDNFQMLRNLFDYMLVDEAGQILPYYLLGPLYRSRNAIIVGDEKQLEPIRDIKNNVYDKYIERVSDKLNANIATAQSLANLGSDFYEENTSSGHIEIEGIMLEEHRRCERSIAQFSNKYVYDNRMIIANEDKKKDYLGNNVCFIDIRGIKSKKHINQSEVNVIAALLDDLVKIYKPSDIAVIAPYKNQVNAIKTKINNPLIKVGTVHSFQGKDKEVVIMSMTIHSEKDSSAKRFIGEKPNMLNVAFTRAKQQLFIVGNFSVLENVEKSNFLYKTGEFVKSVGKVFSIYDSELLDNLSAEEEQTYLKLIQRMSSGDSSKRKELFGDYVNKVGLLEDDNHYKLLLSLFDGADSSITVVCPWMTKSVIKDEFIDNIKNFYSKSKKYNIVFGYMKSKDTLNTKDEIKKIVKRDNNFPVDIDKEAERILKLQSVMGDNLIYSPPLHTKVLIVDNEFLLIGSHNWLAKQGQRKGDREEITIIVDDLGMIEYINEKFGIK